MGLDTGAHPDGLEEKPVSHTKLFVVCLTAIALGLIVTFMLVKVTTISGKGAMVYYRVYEQGFIEGNHEPVPIYSQHSYHFYGKNVGYEEIVDVLSGLHKVEYGDITICNVQYNIKP